jgi:hypothetical protein
MRSRKLLIAALSCALSVLFVGAANAQSTLDPTNTSSHQYVDAESPAVQTAPLTTISRLDFRLMGLAMLWSQLAWAPASPMRMPSMLALVAPGDRRWGLR